MQAIEGHYLKLVFLTLCLTPVSFFLGCSNAENTLPDLVKVNGSVTFDGEPVEGARVSFAPEKADSQGRGRTSVGITNSLGIFELMYNKDTEGAIVGTHRVTISKMEDAGPELIPAKYNANSQLTANVTQEGSNDFNFVTDP